MANETANRLKYLMASGDIDFSADTFKMILMETGFTFNKDTHHQLSDVSGNELASAGYGGAQTLAPNPANIAEDDVDDRTEVTWNNVSFVAVGGAVGPTPGAIIYDDTDANDSLVGFIDFGAEYTQANGGTMTIIDVEVRIS
jgi:hypothetical protein